jgi:hypothetical protein
VEIFTASSSRGFTSCFPAAWVLISRPASAKEASTCAQLNRVLVFDGFSEMAKRWDISVSSNKSTWELK